LFVTGEGDAADANGQHDGRAVIAGKIESKPAWCQRHTDAAAIKTEGVKP